MRFEVSVFFGNCPDGAFSLDPAGGEELAAVGSEAEVVDAGISFEDAKAPPGGDVPEAERIV